MISEDIHRMLHEAKSRIEDGGILASSGDSFTDSSQLLEIIGFEILLKCVVRLSNQKAGTTHNYKKLWRALPGYRQKAILDYAKSRLPGHTDFSNIEDILDGLTHIYMKGRYFYEFYEGKSFKEQEENGNIWEEMGRPPEVADIRYFPLELQCLNEALIDHLESAL